MPRHANQYTVLMPATYISVVPFQKSTDPRRNICPWRWDRYAEPKRRWSTNVDRATTHVIEDFEYSTHWHDIMETGYMVCYARFTLQEQTRSSQISILQSLLRLNSSVHTSNYVQGTVQSRIGAFKYRQGTFFLTLSVTPCGVRGYCLRKFSNTGRLAVVNCFVDLCTSSKETMAVLKTHAMISSTSYSFMFLCKYT